MPFAENSSAQRHALCRNEAAFLLFLSRVSGTNALCHSSELESDKVPLRPGFTQLGSLRDWPQGMLGHTYHCRAQWAWNKQGAGGMLGWALVVGEEDEVRSSPITEHGSHRGPVRHKGHSPENWLVGMRTELQANVLLRTCVNLISQSCLQPWPGVGTWSGKAHLKRTQRPRLQERVVTEPLSRPFLLVILIVLFSV